MNQTKDFLKLNPFDFLVACIQPDDGTTKRSTEYVYPYSVIITFVIVWNE